MSLGRLAPGTPKTLTPGIIEVDVGFTGADAADPTGIEGKGVTVVRNGAAGKYRITVSGTGKLDIIGVSKPSILSTSRDWDGSIEAIDETNRRVDILTHTLAAAGADLTTNDRCFVVIRIKETTV